MGGRCCPLLGGRCSPLLPSLVGSALPSSPPWWEVLSPPWWEVLSPPSFSSPLELSSYSSGPNNTRALDNAMRYRRQLKTGLIKTYEHVKAEEEKRLTDVYVNTKMSKLCREESLRKVSFCLVYCIYTL